MWRRARLPFALAHALAAVAALCAAPAALATFPGVNGRIVVEQNLPLFSVLEEGGLGFRLTAQTYAADAPAISPDGSLVAYRHGAGTPSGYGIWSVGDDGTGAQQITVDAQAVAANDTDPAWSPDGGRLAFVRNGDLHVMNADGSATTNLTPDFVSTIADPDWSPDGSRIAFAASNQIFVMGAGGTPGPTQLNPTAPGNRSNPSWSPDGSRIAYARGPGASPVAGVWTINADGSGEGPLISNMNEVWELAWSPDGSKIGFIRDAGNPVQEELWIVGADGGGLTVPNVDADTGMDWGTRAAARQALPPPVLGRAVNAEVVRGKVLVAVPGGATPRGAARASQKGVKFVPLKADRQIPVGSFLDTTKGTVELRSATGKGSKTQSGQFSSGLFQVLQSRARKAKGLTELRLKGASFGRCRARGAAGGPAAAAALSKKTINKLRAAAKGKYRSRGKHSAATVRGTVWITADRCDGTLTTVKRGKVSVRDFRRGRTITVRAGQSYLARAPR